MHLLSYRLNLGDKRGMAPTQIELQSEPTVRVHLCVPDDQEAFLPRRRRAPPYLPANAPLPRKGEVIYLSSSSAWRVSLVIHEWRSPIDLHVEVWIEHIGAARLARPPGFVLTQ